MHADFPSNASPRFSALNAADDSSRRALGKLDIPSLLAARNQLRVQRPPVPRAVRHAAFVGGVQHVVNMGTASRVRRAPAARRITDEMANFANSIICGAFGVRSSETMGIAGALCTLATAQFNGAVIRRCSRVGSTPADSAALPDPTTSPNIGSQSDTDKALNKWGRMTGHDDLDSLCLAPDRCERFGGYCIVTRLADSANKRAAMQHGRW